MKANDVYHELKADIPGQYLSRQTVFKWFAHFRNDRKHLKDLPRNVRPITEANTTNIQRVRTIIEEDPWCTYDNIEAESSLFHGTIQRIIHDHLKLKKVVSRWVSHRLIEQNRQDRVRICQENLARFEEGKWRLCDVLTGDEVWIYFLQNGRKQSNMSWVAKDESPRTVVRQSRYQPKAMFTLSSRLLVLYMCHV